MTSYTNNTEAEQPDTGVSSAKMVDAKAAHDIRASLLIVNGFNQVLAASFNDLLDAYHAVFQDHPDILQGDVAVNLKELESDCGSCILQARRSVENLSIRIADYTESNTNNGHEGSTDVW